MKDENVHFTYDFSEEKTDDKFKLPMWVLGTLGGLVAVIVILITIIIINANKSDKTEEKIIQFHEACFEVVFEGYNTMGEAYVKPVYSEIKKAILAVVEDMDNSDEILKRVMDNISFHIDVDENLSNGESVTVYVNVKEEVLNELELEISNTEYSVKVTGLKILSIINAFETMAVVKVDNDSAYGVKIFNPSGWSGISEDDFECVINSDNTVTISIKDSIIHELGRQGIVAGSTEKNYDIEKLNNKLLVSYDDITEESLSNLIFSGEVWCFSPGDDYFCDNIEYYGGWINVYEDAPICNELVMIYKMELCDNYGNVVVPSIYRKITRENVTVYSDNTIRAYGDMTLDTGVTCVGEDAYAIGALDINEYVEELKYSDEFIYTYFDPKGQIY